MAGVAVPSPREGPLRGDLGTLHEGEWIKVDGGAWAALPELVQQTYLLDSRDYAQVGRTDVYSRGFVVGRTISSLDFYRSLFQFSLFCCILQKVQLRRISRTQYIHIPLLQLRTIVSDSISPIMSPRSQSPSLALSSSLSLHTTIKISSLALSFCPTVRIPLTRSPVALFTPCITLNKKICK